MKQVFLIISLSLSIMIVHGQKKCEMQVAKAVTSLIKGMEDGNLELLSTVVSPKVSYGHSGGKVENRESFFNALKTGASDFVKINITDQTIETFGKTALVRHKLDATTNDNQKPGTVKLNVLTVWKKSHGKWMMIARQAIKPPAEK